MYYYMSRGLVGSYHTITMLVKGVKPCKKVFKKYKAYTKTYSSFNPVTNVLYNGKNFYGWERPFDHVAKGLFTNDCWFLITVYLNCYDVRVLGLTEGILIQKGRAWHRNNFINLRNRNTPSDQRINEVRDYFNTTPNESPLLLKLVSETVKEHIQVLQEVIKNYAQIERVKVKGKSQYATKFGKNYLLPQGTKVKTLKPSFLKHFPQLARLIQSISQNGVLTKTVRVKSGSMVVSVYSGSPRSGNRDLI